MENYIVINGKKSELTEEQIRLLGIEVKENPFDVKNGDEAYYVNNTFEIYNSNLWWSKDKNTYCPCKNKKLVEERAKQEQLSRLLWKFANENDDVSTEEELENGDILKWYITNYDNCDYCVEGYYATSFYGAQAFKTEAMCQRAIDEVVIPFMNGEID